VALTGPPLELDSALSAPGAIEPALAIPLLLVAAGLGYLVGTRPRGVGRHAAKGGRADRAALERLEQLARTDALTALPNRRAWEEELPRELARAARTGSAVSVALIDLDRFKLYNDRYGHQAGDRLLAAAAAEWQVVLRQTDRLARYGGEEFGLVLPDCGLEDAVRLVERLRAATPRAETCSAGIAEWDGSEVGEALVARADDALYAAKRSGRDRAFTAGEPLGRAAA
jgi:diguanylate cyclase (GGDEF)-like protein